MISSCGKGWLADLGYEDEEKVLRALHAACPCSGSSAAYERFLGIVTDLKKDPRPRVRKSALHLEQDALGALALQDEEASGWVRNRPGGNGRRGEARRAHVRYR